MKKEELISDIERLEKRLKMAKESGMLPEIAEKKQLEKINSLKDELKKIEDEEKSEKEKSEKKPETKKPKSRSLKDVIDQNAGHKKAMNKITGAHLSNKVIEYISSSLSNDEESTDEEMISDFVEKTGISKSLATKIVKSERNKVLKDMEYEIDWSEYKEEKETKTSKINFGELGSKVELPGGHIVSKTSDTQAILFFKGDQKETVAFTFENGSWIIDCCEKRGDKYPEYSKSELDDAVWYIIDELECKEQTEKRIDAIRKRKKYVKEQNELSEPEKVVNTVEKAAESVENRVEEIVEKGSSFPPSKAEEVGEEFIGIIETVKGAIKKQSDAKAFIKKLIEELQKLL